MKINNQLIIITREKTPRIGGTPRNPVIPASEGGPPETDFGKDFSAQLREEWRSVKLTYWGKGLAAKEWRTFQQQFETAADRVLDKREREVYDLLFDQLSGYRQEKVVKEERTQQGNKF